MMSPNWLKKGSLGLMAAVMMTFMMAGNIFAADAAAIVTFVANATSIKAGETVTLSWQVTGASHVELIGMEKEDEAVLPLTGAIEAWPMTTTSYTLIAYGLDGNGVSKSLTVNVGTKGDVKIDSFNASTAKVTPGQTVLLSWKVSNGTSVRIMGIEKEDEVIWPLQGSVAVWPAATTTYILEATGFNGEVASASVTVNVTESQGPTIISFTANKTEIRPGELVIMSWITQNALYCTIVTSSGKKLLNRLPIGLVLLTPDITTTYTLTAYGINGTQTTGPLTITVR
jgi:uncharacterized cupredoxin-like copper-binding protein